MLKKMSVNIALQKCSDYPGQLNVISHLGYEEERMEHLKEISEEDNFYRMVSRYETALSDLFTRSLIEQVPGFNSTVRVFRKVELDYLFVEEAHRLKHYVACMNIVMRHKLNARRRLLITGTPL